jgi:hypothetical protein
MMRRRGRERGHCFFIATGRSKDFPVFSPVKVMRLSLVRSLCFCNSISSYLSSSRKNDLAISPLLEVPLFEKKKILASSWTCLTGELKQIFKHTHTSK